MKFGKLLAAGKSWAGGHGVGRYQMRDGLHLPKFISPKNPFKQEAVARPSAPPVVAAAPAMSVAMAAVEPALMPEVTTAPVAAASELAAPKLLWKTHATNAREVVVGLFKLAGEFAKRSGVWLKRGAFFCLDHNPFSAIGKPRLAGIPRFGKPAVQGELSLDRVKVVRNDLSHADLEVVGQK
ncbi:MAG: hypothetical protein QM813_13560 [Verrucomicrobiota bacterium]